LKNVNSLTGGKAMTWYFKRTRLIVDRPVQFRLLGRLGAYLLIYTVTLLHVGFAIEVFEKVVMANDGPLVVDLYADYLVRQRALLIGMVLIMPVLLYDLLKFSHRIVGPLFRCRRWMLEMAEGKTVREFIPRKHDLMTELFEAFNVLIKSCNARAATAPGAPQAPAVEGAAEADDVSDEQHVRV
jgi:hypothetical protein